MAEERSEEQIIAQQFKMCDWLRSHKMYNEWDGETMNSVQAIQIFDKLEPALTMLEQTLGMFESLADRLQPEEYEEFRTICAATADLRDGENV
jgi:hypothetical protein